MAVEIFLLPILLTAISSGGNILSLLMANNLNHGTYLQSCLWTEIFEVTSYDVYSFLLHTQVCQSAYFGTNEKNRRKKHNIM